MQSPKVSIVLPTFNGAKYIKKSIESCINQTFKDFELIIVNDCSTDNTPSIIKFYAEMDSRIRIVNNEFNKRLPLSLNAGFEIATGKYFTWTSDDNYYSSDALDKLLTIIDDNSSIDLVYTDYSIIDQDDNVIGFRTFGDVYHSFNKWLGAGACFLYKKEIHSANNGYNPAAFLIEDYDFFVRAFMKFNFYYLQSSELYYYREHAASLTSTQNSSINDLSKIFLERNLPGLEKKLPEKEKALLYRKFASYYAITKNNKTKYYYYLLKLRCISVSQTLLTVFYVAYKKAIDFFIMSVLGIFYFFKILIKKKFT